MAMDLRTYLDDLEQRINPSEEERLAAEWLAYADGHCATPFFSPTRQTAPTAIHWPMMYVNDAFQSTDRMIYQQLRLVSNELIGGHGNLLNVRANYGTGIIPSMFGAEMFTLDTELDTLPCTRPLPDGEAGIRLLLDRRDTDYTRGLAGKVFDFAAQYAEAVKDYPLIRRHVHVYNPDLQGPFPLIDALWGGDIYVALYDEEDLIHEAMDYMTEVFLGFIARWQSLFPTYDAEHSVEWGLLHRGKVIIRNDAAMNISGQMYRQFVAPYDQRILDALGGGIHFCGRGDHYIQPIGEMRNISCINLSQPECNNMETIYTNTVDRGIGIIGLPAEETLRATNAGRPLRGLVHSGASLAAWKDAAPARK